ncbi:Response regulator of zinc sigma-54-dependent two-component system [Thioalkalivibrio nitratireducens DSM 14787]|uniref:Response regulator of zinc sigma-54-dependent two-component system n=1 Tax=Thioalkalivibrio nitratireducens (strain DSM 14787 / UNIQEM 213 / ALEN2) TaxID=1255043 RepID=L0DZM1_THIND|nr:sigma-54 dependent transcriptional regulator [Thioalkalivibrio nitratireducens]AGA34390.1 Response regulator of zinc sigma-54-dependent two-component system [Thioalkalivibrio nitratireducens DSM 14787]
MTARVLIVDDERGLRRTLEFLLSKEGFDVSLAQSGEEAVARFDEQPADLVLTDLRMEGMSGLDVVREIKRRVPETEVLVMTAYGSIDTAVEAMKLGATDYITKPARNDEILLKVRKALDGRSLRSEVAQLRTEVSGGIGLGALVAKSPAMREVLARIHKVAPTHLTILITGETGTGKSCIARAIHHHSQRSDGQFVSVNCAALPEPLLESELFGHAKGAFTGATQARRGLFEEAHNGTLFLDEIGTLPANMQAKLLGALQDREVRRVGSNTTQAVDVRVIAATNADLEEAVAREEFREDLFYRLNVARLQVPPLRERREDIPVLVRRILERLPAGDGCDGFTVDDEAMSALCNAEYPGNVRELENALEWAAAVCRGRRITVADIPETLQRPARTASAPAAVHEEAAPADGSLARHERQIIEESIVRCRWNLTAAAKSLGIGRTTLWRKMRQYNIGRDPASS